MGARRAAWAEGERVARRGEEERVGVVRRAPDGGLGERHARGQERQRAVPARVTEGAHRARRAGRRARERRVLRGPLLDRDRGEPTLDEVRGEPPGVVLVEVLRDKDTPAPDPPVEVAVGHRELGADRLELGAEARRALVADAGSAEERVEVGLGWAQPHAEARARPAHDAQARLVALHARLDAGQALGAAAPAHARGDRVAGGREPRCVRRQRAAHLGRGLEAVLGVLRHRALDRAAERERKARLERRGIGDRAALVLLRERERRARAKGRPPRRELEQHDAEAVEVRTPIHHRRGKQLGGHVLGRPEHRCVRGQPCDLVHARDAEVEELEPARRVREHVLRLEIPVHDALGVRGLERAEDLLCHCQELGRGQLAGLAQPQLEVRTVEVLHDEAHAVVRADEVVDGDHRGVADATGDAELLAEARDDRVIRAQLGVQDLERDHGLGGRVLREVDGGHAALAEHALHLVALRQPHHDPRAARDRHW